MNGSVKSHGGRDSLCVNGREYLFLRNLTTKSAKDAENIAAALCDLRVFCSDRSS